ncbi:MAG: TonB-dependent receptor [Chitinophagales bacterium]
MNTNFFLKALIIATLCFSYQENLFAQSADSIPTQPIPEVIVTATRTEKNINDIGREVTVISNAEIQKQGATTLAELLSNYAGVSIIGANQNPGMTQSLFMRGTGSNQTVIMIDGVPISDPSSTNNAVDLNELPLSNIDQIEIVRGSHSTLYGSAAIGGAINIITKKEQEPGFHADARLMGGIFGSNTSQLEENIFLNCTFKNGFYANLDGFNTNINGIDATIDTSTTSASFRSFDQDDFDQQRIAAKVGFINKQWNVFGAYSYTNTAAGYDKAGFKYRSFDIPTTLYDGDSTRIFTKRNFANYKAGYRLTEKFDLQLTGGYSTLHRSTIDDSSLIDASGTGDHTYSDGRYEGTEMNHELLGNYGWTNMQLTAGIGMNRETMTSGTHYYNSAYQFELVSDLDTLELSSTLLNAFAQLDMDGTLFSPSLKELNIILGARYNHHDLFGSTIVYEINPSYQIGKWARIFASYSTGFNAPSLYQMYAPDNYYTSGITRGNPDLQPEYAHSLEAGIKFFPKKTLSYGISIYSTTVQHAIEYVYLWDKNVPIDELGQDFYRDDFRGDTYLNAGTQHSMGVDAYFSAQLLKWLSIDGNLSIVKGKLTYSADAIDTSHTAGNHVQLYSNGAFPVADVETEGLVRRPSTANVGATFFPVKNASLRLSGKWVSGYNDIYYDYTLVPYGALNTVPLNDYFLFDLVLKYEFHKNFGASLKVENLLNTTYTEIRGFATKGTGVYLTLRGSF